MQETHSTEVNVGGQMKGALKFGFSHGDSRSRGVGILFDRNLKVMVHNVLSSETGRYLITYMTLNERKWLLGNVYVPNKDSREFFQQLKLEVNRFTPDYTLIGWGYQLGPG